MMSCRKWHFWLISRFLRLILQLSQHLKKHAWCRLGSVHLILHAILADFSSIEFYYPTIEPSSHVIYVSVHDCFQVPWMVSFPKVELRQSFLSFLCPFSFAKWVAFFQANEHGKHLFGGIYAQGICRARKMSALCLYRWFYQPKRNRIADRRILIL